MGWVSKGLGNKRRRTWERSTHIHGSRVPQDLHQGGVRKWMERAAGGRTSAQLVADRRQEDPRPPGSRTGPTMSRRSSHRGLSRSVRRCEERKDAMDGKMKLPPRRLCVRFLSPRLRPRLCPCLRRLPAAALLARVPLPPVRAEAAAAANLARVPAPAVRAEARAAVAGAPTVRASGALAPVLASLPHARTASVSYLPFEERFKGQRQPVGASRLSLGLTLGAPSPAEVVFSSLETGYCGSGLGPPTTLCQRFQVGPPGLRFRAGPPPRFVSGFRWGHQDY